MVRRSWLLAGVGAALALAWPVAGTPSLGRPLPSAVRPHAFGSCAQLVGYAQSHYATSHGIPDPPMVGVATATSLGVAGGAKSAAASPSASSGAVNGSAADTGAGTSYSTTNNQEAGVDEPDIAKTDGSTIFSLAQDKLEAVSVGGSSPSLAGSLDLGTAGTNAQLLLDGDRILVVSTPPTILPMMPVAGGAVPVAVRSSPYWAYGSKTVITEVDVSDPAHMAVTQTATVDGRFVDARQSGGSARIVISSAPQVLAQPQLAGTVAGWIPKWSFKDRRSGRHFTRQVASCGDISRPVQFSGLGMINILTVDFSKGLQAAQSTSLMADAQIVYGSPTSLYIATQQWVNPAWGIAQLPPSQTTVIDKFDVSDPDTTTYLSSGEVPGYLLNQFSLSESGGYLRVASTSRPIWWGVQPPQSSQSFVTVLQQQGGVLAPVGQVSGLGQGEQIYSVRFVGNTGYVVTYHQVDPLYTIDLSTPTAPKVVGQLDLQGYSAYLHPLSGGLLLGVGQDVSTDTNEPTGAQLELFDVSDPANPKLLAKTTLGTGSSTAATYDHHAFLYWPATNLVVLPVQVYGYQVYTPGTPGTPGTPIQPAQPFTGAYTFRVSSSGLQPLSPLVQDKVNGSVPPIERAIVVGSRLYTVSDEGVMASALDTLARQAFVSFGL
jgi:hypothetical protein